MPVRIVDREDVVRLVEVESAQLVEVLSREEREWEHLPGALHIPLRDLDKEAPGSWTGRNRWSSTATSNCAT